MTNLKLPLRCTTRSLNGRPLDVQWSLPTPSVATYLHRLVPVASGQADLIWRIQTLEMTRALKLRMVATHILGMPFLLVLAGLVICTFGWTNCAALGAASARRRLGRGSIGAGGFTGCTVVRRRLRLG